MFGYHLIKHDSKDEGTGKEFKIKQGYNAKTNTYFISITSRKTLYTMRVNMDPDYFESFYRMGAFTKRQTEYEKANLNHPSDKQS